MPVRAENKNLINWMRRLILSTLASFFVGHVNHNSCAPLTQVNPLKGKKTTKHGLKIKCVIILTPETFYDGFGVRLK